MKKNLFCIAAIIAILIASIDAGASSRYKWSYSEYYKSQPQFMVYNPANKLFYGIIETTVNTRLYVSYDMGRNWLFKSIIPFNNIESFKIDKNGNIYFGYKFDLENMAVIRSADDGLTFDTVMAFKGTFNVIPNYFQSLIAP